VHRLTVFLASATCALAAGGLAGAGQKSAGLISFWSDRAGFPGVWIMDADGRHPRLVTGKHWGKRGSWSPDGKRLVFDAPVDLKPNAPSFNFDLFLINPDGSALRRLTRGAQRDILASWAPDGRTIAFTRLAKRDRVEEIWLVHADGTGLRRLRAGANPVWSPDGRSIAFSAPLGRRYALFVMEADGGNTRRLTGPGADAGPGDWSPDGRRLLFTRWSLGQNGDVWVMDADGGEQRRLTRSPADDFDPTWSPDGRRVLFTSDRRGNKDVYVMDSDGSHVARLTTSAAEDWATDWQH
jgi:Tol biopolymer transport system component